MGIIGGLCESGRLFVFVAVAVVDGGSDRIDIANECVTYH